MIGPRVARWYICSAESDRSTPIHCTSANSSCRSGRQGEQRCGADPEHPGGHVGSLDVPAEPPHLERLVAGHRRLQDAVEPAAVVDHPGQQTFPTASIDRGGRRSTDEQRQIVDGDPGLAWHHLATRAEVLAGSVRSRRRCCWRARDRRGGTARRPTPPTARRPPRPSHRLRPLRPASSTASPSRDSRRARHRTSAARGRHPRPARGSGRPSTGARRRATAPPSGGRPGIRHLVRLAGLALALATGSGFASGRSGSASGPVTDSGLVLAVDHRAGVGTSAAS